MRTDTPTPTCRKDDRIGTGSQIIQWTHNALATLFQDMSINHGGFQIQSQ